MLIIVLTVASLLHNVHAITCSVEPDEAGHVVIPATLTHIKKASFNACKTIRSIFIHKDVTIIDKQAFFRAENLVRVDFEEGSALQIIDTLAFFKTGLVSISIPTSVTRIGASAFASIGTLKTVHIPVTSRLTSISSVAFSSTGLESFQWPPLVENMEASVFLHTPALRSVTFTENSRLKTIAKAAFKSSNLDTIAIPRFVETIGPQAFFENTAMSTVYFAAGCNNAVRIDQEAFKGTSVNSLEIPRTASCDDCGVETVLQGCGPPMPLSLPPSAIKEEVHVHAQVNKEEERKEQKGEEKGMSTPAVEVSQLGIIGGAIVGFFAIAFVLLLRSETKSNSAGVSSTASARTVNAKRAPKETGSHVSPGSGGADDSGAAPTPTPAPRRRKK